MACMPLRGSRSQLAAAARCGSPPAECRDNAVDIVQNMHVEAEKSTSSMNIGTVSLEFHSVQCGKLVSFPRVPEVAAPFSSFECRKRSLKGWLAQAVEAAATGIFQGT